MEKILKIHTFLATKTVIAEAYNVNVHFSEETFCVVGISCSVDMMRAL